MSANVHGIFALTGRAHCQHQVAFFKFICILFPVSVIIPTILEVSSDSHDSQDWGTTILGCPIIWYHSWVGQQDIYHLDLSHAPGL